MSEAIVKLQAFDQQQKIYIVNREFEKKSIQEIYNIKIDKLADFLTDLNNIKTIHIMRNEEYAKPFIKEIQEKEILKYNNKKFQICINE